MRWDERGGDERRVTRRDQQYFCRGCGAVKGEDEGRERVGRTEGREENEEGREEKEGGREKGE